MKRQSSEADPSTKEKENSETWEMWPDIRNHYKHNTNTQRMFSKASYKDLSCKFGSRTKNVIKRAVPSEWTENILDGLQRADIT